VKAEIFDERFGGVTRQKSEKQSIRISTIGRKDLESRKLSGQGTGLTIFGVKFSPAPEAYEFPGQGGNSRLRRWLLSSYS
jgi:hypothetical protein